jgi:hypothetical protein
METFKIDLIKEITNIISCLQGQNQGFESDLLFMTKLYKKKKKKIFEIFFNHNSRAIARYEITFLFIVDETIYINFHKKNTT